MFQNTQTAMQQLLNAMSEGGALLQNMSQDERYAFDELLDMCKDYTEQAEEMLEDFENQKAA